MFLLLFEFNLYNIPSTSRYGKIGDALLVVGGLSWDKKGNTHKRSASFAELASTEIARVHSARLGKCVIFIHFFPILLFIFQLYVLPLSFFVLFGS